METNSRSRNVTLKVCIDVILLSIFASFLALFYNYLTPSRRGFFCDDEDIMYPEKKEQISDQKLWCIAILVPVALIILTEAYRHIRGTCITTDSGAYFFGWEVPRVFEQVYSSTGMFLFGIIMAEMVANYIKILVGRLRPAFLVTCQPDFKCSQAPHPNFYVQNFTCTNPDLKDANDLSKSFPSGHTAVSTFAMLYAVLYLQKRLEIGASSLCKPLIQLLLLLLATYISLTRIQDNKHHWDDIVGGFFVGFTICLTMVFSQTDLFKSENNVSTDTVPKFQP